MSSYGNIIQEFEVPFHYDVHFTHGVFSSENPLLRDLINDKNTRVVVILDSGVAEHWPQLKDDIHTYFDGKARIEIVPGGEQVKNSLSHVENILKMVNDFGIDRHAYVIAVGGGAVLDMAGFAAAIAHRGVRHIRIPTTVLSQNDSGVGVKNGVNLFGKKNFIGTFAPPSVVINDALFLETLDIRDWRGGISEAVKVALLKDEAFFYWIENNVERLNARDLAAMEQLVHRCADLHVNHISGNGDPFEFGSSRPLDFGHWSAHKLEHLTEYRVRHGEAVAIGMALDVAYAAEIELIPTAIRDRIVRLLSACGFDIYHALLGEDGISPELYKGIQEFREHLGGDLTLTLIKGIGEAEDIHVVSEDALDAAVNYLKDFHAH